jgi:prepilin-type N-terminal cleavage/methylation domain-containing protein
MRSKLQKSNSEGFTIIEIMIVLVIAGLILLIVFLAVPALQRSARNTSRKADASALAASVSEFINNNNGVVPTTLANAAGAGTLTGPTGTASASSKLGYYTTGAGAANGDAEVVKQTALPTYTGGGGHDYLAVVTGGVCAAAGANQGTAAPTWAITAASARSFVVVYQIETGNGLYQAVCTSD